MSRTIIRLERKSDVDEIRRIHDAAFGTLAESALVDNLEVDGDAVLSRVAWCDGVLAGHVLFSRMKAVESRGLRVTALAPLGVVPDMQGRGIATALVRDGIDLLHREGEDLVTVLGAPAFYSRFGFSTDAAKAYSTRHDGPDFQVLALTEAGRRSGGVLSYAAAFSAMA